MNTLIRTTLGEMLNSEVLSNTLIELNFRLSTYDIEIVRRISVELGKDREVTITLTDDEFIINFNIDKVEYKKVKALSEEINVNFQRKTKVTISKSNFKNVPVGTISNYNVNVSRFF